MTDWNYFLVNIYLSFNFLINPVCSRKEGRGATVFLVLLCRQQNIWEKFQGSKVLNLSLRHQHQSKLLAFSLVAETILSFWRKHLHKEYRALCFCPPHGSCCPHPGPALAKCTSGAQDSPGTAGASVVAEGWGGKGLSSVVTGRQNDVPHARGCRGAPSLLFRQRCHQTSPTFFPLVVHPRGATAWSCSALCLRRVAHSETGMTSVFLKTVQIESGLPHSE